MRTPISLTYDDVLLVPQYSDIKSRSEIEVGVAIGGRYSRPIHFKLPIISSPMDTVTGAAMANVMNKSGGLGIIHRYCTVDEQAKMVRRIKAGMKAAAIGVTGDYMERAQELVNNDCKILCIDVAHGHHISVKKAIKALKKKFDDRAIIIAGNVATADGYCDLSDWGADAVRVGIGGGSICSTRIQTGHGVPTLQSIMDCVNSYGDAYIIADGGIRFSGDIAKINSPPLGGPPSLLSFSAVS